MKKKDSKDKFTKNRLTIRYRGVNMRGVYTTLVVREIPSGGR